MRKIVIVVLAFIVVLAIASSAYADWVWKNLGADPFAKTRTEAMQNREKAFKALGIPEADIASIIDATDNPGGRVSLEKGRGDRLSAMLSKGYVVHRSVVVGIESVPTEAWKIVRGERTYIIFLPDGCFNWGYFASITVSAASSPTPTPTSAAPPSFVKTDGCVEIYFTTKAGDTAVKFAIIGPAGPDVIKNACTGIKRAGETGFGPWRNEACPAGSPILCDFSEHEKVLGQKVQLKGSYALAAHGEHVLRLPGFISGKKSGYVTALVLVRGVNAHPPFPTEKPGDPQAFAAAYKYGEARAEWIENNSDAMGVRWFDYTNGAARVYYTLAEVPKDAAQLYWPWAEWRKK